MRSSISTSHIELSKIINQRLDEGRCDVLFALYYLLIVECLNQISEDLRGFPLHCIMLLEGLHPLPNEIVNETAENSDELIKLSIVLPYPHLQEAITKDKSEGTEYLLENMIEHLPHKVSYLGAVDPELVDIVLAASEEQLQHHCRLDDCCQLKQVELAEICISLWIDLGL